ncbi:Putative von Willebrand factor, type A, AAA+ ATPase domain, midasin, midasin, AAA lid domain 7 [Septoria linicola]|uniref:Midasin n=1 Tax=Septoria linicola TaxID=215465 RepID=A0A9Q9AVV9_9PEZI|nr:Putative von Willebrand factor, type A, AAA+ ATPase domain, midasin, midasin, AAA lid domain 7 [Septoria linicola]
MECAWDAQLLQRSAELPAELLQIIQDGSSNEKYLEVLVRTAHDPRYTYILLAHCENIFAHICASLREYGSLASTIATLGRIIPHAPYLSSLATALLESERYQLGQGENDGDDLLYLLGLFRLIRCNPRTYAQRLPIRDLWRILETGRPSSKYLAIRILQIHLQGADHWFETTLQRYLGEDQPDEALEGSWDEQTIDYRFLSLREEKRNHSVQCLRAEIIRAAPAVAKVRTISEALFHPSTSLVGGVLLPSAGSTTPKGNSLVETETTSSNLRTLASALKSSNPLLLTGLAGSGKTLLIRHAAQSLGKLDKMVTLHLNEQSDAKILLGVHTTGDQPRPFSWKPGVLTTAVQEGRWVVIEDLDKAPNEVLGTLLPLIEHQELSIPSRKDTIHAAEGFRILATVRSTVNHRGEESRPLTHMVGARHWRQVPIAMSSPHELATVIRSLYPSLGSLIPRFMAVYERLIATKQQSVLIGQSKTGVARVVGPRDMLKCFLEAVDSFLGALPDDDVRSGLAAVIAEELHIDPHKRQHLLRDRDPQYSTTKNRISAGRHSILRTKHTKLVQGSFSTNPHTCRTLESVLAAVVNQEPLLLVGETGVGKTTAVQNLAMQLGKKLVPFNLSQQTEAGDLLGGFKPVNPRTLMVPLKDEFDDLFRESFPSAKNEKFVALLKKTADKNNWTGVCKLFRTAVGMVNQERAATPPREEGEAPAKKRKTASRRTIDFARWDAFFAKMEAIEQRLGSAEKAVAFTFIEGNIVQAVRNGDWVLLDEINLASSDTLESIVDLLDSSPSLLLTEAGNIERIEAHSDFRVFAAMNPATDVGKKDLPPGIRSRFTELYVESPDKDAKSLEGIIRSWLGAAAVSDVKVASKVRELYQKIIAMSQDNKLVDGAGQKPHFSLRTLTRTLSYAKHIQQMCSLRRALYEGFQMSFLTFLDAESAALIQPYIEHYLFGETKINVKAELKRALRKPEDGHIYVQGHPGSKHWIRKGAEEPQDQESYIITNFVARNLENLVRAASTRQFPVLIQGPTSAGKTSMIEYLAQRTGHRFTRINNHEHTDLQEYLGTYVSGTDGRLQFQEGVLVKALREGHWIVLDELNLAPTDVLEALNRLLDDNRELLVPETQETIRPHPELMLFATQNPAGLYGGRKTLSRAFRNRFLELHFDDIPVNELQEILQRRTQQPASRCARIVNVYRELSVLRQESRLFEQKSFATLRDLFRWAMRPNDTIEQLAANGYMLLCERVRKADEREALKGIIEKAMSEKGPKVLIDESALYAAECPEIQQHLQYASDQRVVWTKAMRRLYVLVSRAMANNEPVLLVGETGCGKTTVCQMLADALKTTLHTVNAHQNTETGDLIGSQRPVRNRGAIESTLREKLRSAVLLQEVPDLNVRSTDDLLDLYDQAMKALPKEQRAVAQQDPAHFELQTCRTRYRALFEWVDGSLVQAMRAGQLFLLDEISLADDSVLERINSVLESSRTILLAEKGSLDSSITAATGFQFFATMNPGGDYGKRELSPALRNRFTEIWVPAMSDMDDVLQIVQSKLGGPAQPYAQPLIEFASWFKRRFDTSASSAVSIRDTLAWTQFINSYKGGDVLTAIVHGAAMVYIDTLGANPAGLMSISSTSLVEERNACFAELGRLLNADARRLYGDVYEVRTSPSNFSIGPFAIDRVASTVATEISFTFDPPTTRSNAMRIIRALQLSKPVLLEGSPGVGKTALVTAIAAATNTPLTRINLSDQTDLIDLFGSDAPVEDGFGWRDAPFLRAMKNGEWVLLDEMNLASQSVLEGLNACLDHRGEVFVPELGLSFARHPQFRLFAAQNPHHQGGGRKGLPASFVNRFTVVYADTFKADDLQMICERSFPTLDGVYIQRAVSFVTALNTEVADRRSFGSSGGPWEFNLRDITRWLALASAGDGLLRAGTPRDFVTMLFTQRFRTAFDRACVNKLFASIFGEAQYTSDLFCTLSTRTLQIGLALLPRDALYTRPLKETAADAGPSRHLRAVQSAMLCVHKAWPVILAGAPGAGKTTVVERLATCVGADVITLGMSAETDALDLIGGYEQHDPHRKMAQALSVLRERRKHVSKVALAEGSVDQSAKLHEAFMNVETSPCAAAMSRLTDLLPTQVRSESLPVLEALATASQSIDRARFEWIDGPLIEAIQQGKWVVLDNANLCSPSVLDRLNGLMEPNGVLIVNEHSASDGSAQIIRPHPGFRIFLTVDPRLGELSRAMRNRAVEIYLDATSSDEISSTDILHPESAMTRFRAVNAVAVTEDEHARIVAEDHLALADMQLIPRFQRELQGVDIEQIDQSLPVGPNTKLEALYQQVTTALQAPADYARVQVSSPNIYKTVHPLNNQPLIQLSQQLYSSAVPSAARHDVRVQLTLLEKALALVKADRKLSDRLTRFWKKAGQQPSAGASRGNSSLLNVLENLLLSMGTWLNQDEIRPLEEVRAVKKILVTLMAYCWTLLRTFESAQLDLPLLTATAIVGQTLTAKTSPLPALESTLARFQGSLKELGLVSDVEARHAFVSMWQTFRPAMPKDMHTLQAILQFEGVVAKFDEATSNFRISLKQVAELRMRFQRALNVNSPAEELNALAEKALASLHASDSDDELIDNAVAISPHFVNAFEATFQRFVVASSTASLGPAAMINLEILALRKTIRGVLCNVSTNDKPARVALDKIRLISTPSTPADTMSRSLDRTAGTKTVLRGVAATEQVSLQALSLLETETDTLGHAIATRAHLIESDIVHDLDAYLRSLVDAVLHALADSNEPGFLANHASKLLQTSHFQDASETQILATDIDTRLAAIAQRLATVVTYLSNTAENVSERQERAAHAWAAFASACLDLYVPEHSFDPVQESQIKTNIFQHAKGNLQAQLEAVQAYRQHWVGEKDSLRARLLAEDITALGEGPQIVQICRPTQSQLSQLHGDLQALSRTISPFRKGTDMQTLSEGAWSNLRVIRDRLDSQYRAYADLTAPVVGFIDCLSIAKRLAASVAAEQQQGPDLAKITPLAAADLSGWGTDDTLIHVQKACQSKEEQLFWLSAVAARSSVTPITRSSRDLRSTIYGVLQLFYEAWTKELDRDQRQAARNSSLYQFRGVDDESEETTVAELNALFPTYDGEDIDNTTRPNVDAQALAQQMAAIHHSLHSDVELTAEILLDLVQKASQLPSSQITSSLIAVISELHKLRNDLSTPPKSRNIYTDADIGQAKTLVALLGRIQKRFEFIHNAWPEHATPIETLRACNTIVAISHSEPLARFLPYVERLHVTVNEWQKVASSEYSVSSLLEEITSLIISWRQLELSTWAGLFNHEDAACKQSAFSWWYIAYEAIIAAAEDEATRSNRSLERFSQQLLETLGSFITNCGLGEFSIRLAMLVDFKADLTVRASDNPALAPVRDALSSLIEFYSHFSAAVSAHWITKRAELETQVKEVVQLASWKDRNIEALKRSAKNSHNRLLRSVKKYRALLAEPVAPLLLAEFPAVMPMSASQQIPDPSTALVQKDVPLTAWTQRPAELQDLATVAEDLLTRSASVKAASKAVKRMESFLQETNEEAAELRKATPSTANEKNKSIVQQLKSRKRRLLADVFRGVQDMGFQKNLGEDVLAQQQSIHGVLSKSPPLQSMSHIDSAYSADYEYHRFLHIMPTVRESSSKHNEDLTPAEIARGKTLLESMLQVTTQQRKSIIKDLVDLEGFRAALSQCSNVADVGCLRVSAGIGSLRESCRSQVRSLLGVVKTAMQVVHMQSELARTQYGDIEGQLSVAVGELHSLDVAISAQVELPARLTTRAIREAGSQFENVVKNLEGLVEVATRQYPELEPVLGHLLRWTTPMGPIDVGTPSSSISANHWAQQLLELVNVARSSSITNGVVGTNGSNKKSWLLDQQHHLQFVAQALNIGNARAELEKLIQTLPAVHSAEGENAQENALDQIAVLSSNVLPVLTAYANNAYIVLAELCTLHATTSKVAHHLGTSFVQLAKQGFCTPSDKAQGEEQQSGQVESGTGLGDGEGGDDISKDVGADEDLSELAQEAKSKEKDEEMDAEKDAVDMADEDLQGDFDEDAGSEGDEQEGKEDGEDADLDEEMGQIGENDDAVDEKQWDDGNKGEEADKEAEKGKGTRNEDQAAAENSEAGDEQETEEIEQDADAGAEMDNEASQQDAEQADPHMQEEQNLDLPDDLQMDGDKEDMSDIDLEDDVPDDLSDVGREEEEAAATKDDLDNLDAEMAEGDGEDEDEKTGEATAPEDGEEGQEQGEDAQSDLAMLDNEDQQEKTDDGLTSADAGQGQEEDSDAAKKSGAVSTVEQQDDDHDANDPSEQIGATEGTQRTQTDETSGQADSGEEQQQSLPFKQLGDVLKQWYNQNRNIEAAQEPQEEKKASEEEMDMNDPRFEHLPEDTESDMQALGAASVEQSKALDEQNAVDVNENMPDDVPLPEEPQEEPMETEPEQESEASGAKGEGVDGGSKPNQTLVGKQTDLDTTMHDHEDIDESDDIERVDEQLTQTHLSHEEPELMTIEEARRQWSDHENRTRNMAIVLTEHLRLILQPTQATKMRGDFRTGKRLNIKKIIPYIASSYKRDKIWMRRSVPSKRTYQIMLAIDDSQSMDEDERKGLAFDTLALIAKSMAMLEVGELSVLGFGETSKVAHAFDMPFTSDAGAKVVRQLTFSQTKTDVKRLLEKSIELFRDARLKATGSASNLWQLQLIISDGLCEDHPSIRQLVRQAHEEQIMVVFIVIDATATESQVSEPKQSILDLNRVEFGKDGNGETSVNMVKYLDTFPFRYYLIVRDVLELPSVLAGALRQWFAEVVGSDG